MKRKLTAVLALLMAVVLVSFGFTVSVNAATNAITYDWKGLHAYDAGFAQGNIILNVDASSGGTYYLYWADDTAALDGYYPICKLTVANSGSASYTMPENTAIPAKATRVLAFKSSSEPTNRSVSAAAINYKLPIDKATYKTDNDILYTFASYSDTHITSNETGAQGAKYPYDEEHLADAFRTAAARDVDFIVTTGDHVTNHRNDEKGYGNPHYPEEWATYLKILAASDYVNPIYEAIGNHELWNYDTETNYEKKDWKTGSAYFRAVTGMDNTTASVNSGKSYYEITEPVTGDHFLFMALEGGFYTDRVNEFTDEQLAWLESKLNAYQNDGKNTFILEHANFEMWGAGDLSYKNVYDIPLKESGGSSTLALKNILRAHKEAVFICGHTHFKFELTIPNTYINYSTNGGTSATIIHNSSVGGVRDISSSAGRVNDTSREKTEGYIVEVYKDSTIFYGTNLYENRIIPAATYIVPQRTSAIAQPTDPPAPTQAPTDPPKPTDPLTEAPKPTNPPTEAPKPTDPPQPTEPPVEIILGDADDDGDATVLDVTYIQRYEANIQLPSPLNVKNADVDGDEDVTIIDATLLQRWLAGIIKTFPAEEYASTGADKEVAAVGAGADIAEESVNLSQAKTALDKYWLLASYDQYQALKKAYRNNADTATLTAAYNDFMTAVGTFYPGDTVNIYFSDNLGWGQVSAYCSAGHGKDKNAEYPGVAMTPVGKNDYGEIIYRYSVPISKYNYVVFNNGSKSGPQTIDLPLGAVNNQGYYYDSALGKDGSKYKCSYYVCDESKLKSLKQ